MESTAVRGSVKIFDKNYVEITIPVKAATGVVIREVDKILKKQKRDLTATKAAQVMLSRVQKRIRKHMKPQPGISFEAMFANAMQQGMLDGEIDFAEMAEWREQASDYDPEVREYNELVMLEVFAFMVDTSRIDDAELLQRLTSPPAVLDTEFIRTSVDEALSLFLTSCGRR